MQISYRKTISELHKGSSIKDVQKIFFLFDIPYPFVVKFSGLLMRTIFDRTLISLSLLIVDVISGGPHDWQAKYRVTCLYAHKGLH